MMGSGKTVTASSLCQLLNAGSLKPPFRFVDLDACLEAKTGKTIPQIFEQEGEPFFRSLEKETLKEVSRSNRQTVATGGGIVLNLENVRVMKKTGVVIYLKTSAEWLWRRVQGYRNRPLLRGKDPKTNLIRILHERAGKYEKAADWEVLTDAKTPAQTAEEILNWLGKNRKA